MVSFFQTSLHSLDKFPSSGPEPHFHWISSFPGSFQSVTKPHNTKFLGHSCWLGPSKPASPYRACSMTSTKLKTSKMQTDAGEQAGGRSSSPQSVWVQKGCPCLLLVHSIWDLWGRKVPKGVSSQRLDKMGREKQSQATAPGLQPFGLKRQGLCLGLPGTAPRQP